MKAGKTVRCSLTNVTLEIIILDIKNHKGKNPAVLALKFSLRTPHYKKQLIERGYLSQMATN